ncbi:hypothetical protein BJV82DRAFT_601600 [Fennellomyces sp. T-0311]|nr:hypothetical protein BJV82DRAFT_601600 [Fennellomyces sp. T-0311]
MYTADLVLDIRAHHNLSPSNTWEHLSKQVRLEAEGMYEKLVGKGYPLVACIESWGAMLMMRKAFWGIKDKESKHGKTLIIKTNTFSTVCFSPRCDGWQSVCVGCRTSMSYY